MREAKVDQTVGKKLLYLKRPSIDQTVLDVPQKLFEAREGDTDTQG